MAEVRTFGLTRRHGAQTALDGLTMAFADGSFTALLGPSGSGKTTLLRLIAGFDVPDAGRIEIGGRDVERVPVERRGIGMVFQTYALFPNMDVARNVGFGLAVRGAPRSEVARAVGDALALVRLGDLGRRRPRQLSGGQRQRVALARALVTRPRVLLLDEPLSALDKALRVEMQVELRRIQREVGITTILVTHDQEEALTMADRVGILREGRLVQVGAPEALYDAPETEFVAAFLGEANILRGRPEPGGLRLPSGTLLRHAPPAHGHEPHAVAVRPERIAILGPEGGAEPRGGNRLRGRIASRLFSGGATTYAVATGDGEIKVRVQNADARRLAEGGAVALAWSPASTIPLREG